MAPAPSPRAVRDATGRRLVARTQSVFFVCLAICVVIDHSSQAQHDGISYYGVHPRTFLLVVVGYLAAALGLWRFAGLLRDASVTPTTWVAMRLVAMSLVALLATPYNRGVLLNWSHMVAGVLCALAQFAVAGAGLGHRRTRRAWAALGLMLAGGLAAAASLPGWSFDELLGGEIVLVSGFGVAWWEWTRAVDALARD